MSKEKEAMESGQILTTLWHDVPFGNIRIM